MIMKSDRYYLFLNCLLFFEVLFVLHSSEHGHGNVPTFYTCEEGLSALTQEGQATLERLEGMLAQSAAQQFHMAGVRTEENKADFEGLGPSPIINSITTITIVIINNISQSLKMISHPSWLPC